MASSGELRRMRLDARLSLSELSAAVGVFPSTLWRWEINTRVPRPSEARRLALVIRELDKICGGRVR